MTKPQGRLHYLDATRGLAAVGVALDHFIGAYDSGLYTSNPAQGHLGLERDIAISPLMIPIQGDFMVQIFFIMSGYVLLDSFLSNSSFLGALLRRYLRLAIPVLFSSLFAWFVILIHLNFLRETLTVSHSCWFGGKNYHIPQFSLEGLVANGLYPTFYAIRNPINPVWWTIPIELSGSVLIMILAAVIRIRFWNPYVFLFIMTLMSWGYYEFFMLCGVWLHFLNKKKPGSFPMTFGRYFLIGLTIIFLASFPVEWASNLTLHPLYYRIIAFNPAPFFDFPFIVKGFDGESFYHGLAALLLIFVITRSGPAQAFLSKFSYLGRISFPLYLVHIPIIWVTSGIFLFLHHYLVSDVLCCAITLLSYLAITFYIASMGYDYVERPTLSISKRVGAWIDVHFSKTKWKKG